MSDDIRGVLGNSRGRRARLLRGTTLTIVVGLALIIAGCSGEPAAGGSLSTAAPAASTAADPSTTAADASRAADGAGGTAPSAAGSAAPAPATSADGSAPGAPASAAPPQKQFPPRDHLNKIVAAYTVANERPELLTGLPCYCPCELYGHGGVIDCHRSQHSAMCNICMDEAIEASQLYEGQLSRGEAGDIAAVQAQVKDRYRRALVAQSAQQLPMMNTQQGRAYLQVCSDCHQPPQPWMHGAGDWAPTLARMEQYARERNAMPSEELWESAIGYIRSVAAQVPPADIAQLRQGLQQTFDHLKETEGDAAYYPSVRDDVLDPAWAVRMAAAYNAARELPNELLASTPTTCQPCADAGNTNLLACLNSWQAITCESAIADIEKLVAERGR